MAKAIDRKKVLNEANIEKLQEAFGKLLRKHAAGVQSAIEDSSDRELTVNIPLAIDDTEASPSFSMRLRYTPEAVTDELVIKCDDPNQPPLILTIEEELKLEARRDRDEERSREQAEKAAKGLKKLQAVVSSVEVN